MKFIKNTVAILAVTASLFSCSKSDDSSTPAILAQQKPIVATVTTLAGSTNGYLDGVGTNAKFKGPVGIVVDASGNLYVTDYDDHKVRKITSNGTTSTLSGSTAGDEVGATTKYSFPYGIEVVNDKIYVCDFNNHKIKTITTTNGDASLYAGSTLFGAAALGNGVGNLINGTLFNGPVCILNNNGNLYVSDNFNSAIKRLQGLSYEFAGGIFGDGVGSGADVKFNSPRGIAADAAGNLYLADAGNHCIKKISPNGVTSLFAGSGLGGAAYKDGTLAEARFSSPNDIAIDANGTMYVADTRNNCIRKISTAGIVSTIAGSTAGDAVGDGSVAKFNLPYGIAIDASGNLYVTDYNNTKIKKITFN